VPESNKRRRERQAASARERAAANRAVAQRAQQRQRAQKILGSVLVLVIIAAVGVYIGVHHTKSNNVAGNRVVASPAVLKAVDSVSDTTLQAVREGATKPVLPTKANDQPLTVGGKPDLLFVGAEWCPFCAAERWSLIESLRQFGTFTGLKQVSSSSSDTDPNTPTFSFYGSTFRSKYLSFTPIESETRDRQTLQTPTKTEQALWEHYTGNPPGFPFIDFDGKYVQTSTGYDPSLLAGLTQAQVAAQLNNPKSSIALAIDGSSNITTATICIMTNNMPANVCLLPAITNAQSALNA
jgi:Domain of unknown function (DUF929)